MNKLIECVPNFSEGRDQKKIKAIFAPLRQGFAGQASVKLLDIESDPDHNRCLGTLVGEP
jgi:glutamate formiminotransferase